MKTILHLTFEDGLKVVDALKNVALENGWEEEEIAESGVVEEYSRVVDAALTAMGFGLEIENSSANEENFPEEEEEEEDIPNEDEDEDEYDFPFDEDTINKIGRLLGL